MMTVSKSLRYFLTVLCWIVFILLPLVLYYFRPDDVVHPAPPYPWVLIFFNLLLTGFYYLNSRYLIPELLLQQKRVQYFAVLAFIIALIIFIPRIYHALSGDHLHEQPQRPLIGFLTSLLFFALVFIISSGRTIISHQLAAARKFNDLQLEKARAELNILKAQIHPHFLFNTLNNIYALSLHQPQLAPPAILKLSSLMRYVTQEGHEELVPLSLELQHLQDYIALQAMRLSDKTTIDIRQNIPATTLKIMPMLLMPFVENAFKYGVSTNEKTSVTILSELRDNMFYFTVQNDIPSRQQNIPEGSRIGIQNTRKRLELFYFGRYQLECKESMGKFIVNLRLLLND